MSLSNTAESSTILVIDDDLGDRLHAVRCIQKSGLDCSLLEAGDIGPAVSQFGGNAVDFILLDYNLPSGNSLSALQELAAAWPASAIVLTTGENSDLVVASAFRAGVSDYIPKLDVSARSIRRVIENGIYSKTLERQVADQTEELRTFAYVLAHDVKAPLRGIRQLCDLAIEAIEDGDVETAKEEVRELNRVSERLDGLVSSLQEHLDVGAVSAFSEESTNAMLDEATRNLRVEVSERGAEIVAHDLPRTFCDRRQIIQLFQNLISNGMKFTKTDAPRIEVTAWMESPDVAGFCIADNGIGIDARYAQTIFEPFKRLHTAEEFSGSGLGLATCKKIVTRHGGRIWCESEPGQGARFLFTLPVTS